MAKRIIRRSAQLRAEVALLEPLEAIEADHLDAKEAYRSAVESGDVAAIRAAKRGKQATANAYEDARTWLRREAEVAKLRTVTIPKLEKQLAGPIMVTDEHGTREDGHARVQVKAALDAARAELESVGREVAAYRAKLEALGATVQGDPVPPDLPPGSADVGMPTVTVKPAVNTRKDRSHG